jgi:hypothetical protein
MRLDANQIREILFVKHNCTLQDFMNHIQLLRGHFNFENTREDEILALLKEVEQDGEYRVVNGTVTQGRPTEPIILKRYPTSEYLRRLMYPVG